MMILIQLRMQDVSLHVQHFCNTLILFSPNTSQLTDIRFTQCPKILKRWFIVKLANAVLMD